MKFADVRAHALSSPIDPPQERRFHGGVRRLRKRDVVVVEVEAADGERGVAPAGASSSAMREFFDDATQGAFAGLIEGRVADLLVGRAFADPAAIRDAIERELPRGLAAEVGAAVDVAVHDVLGKRRGAPIWELLAERAGTTPTTDLRLYASAGMYMPPEGYVEQARTLADVGFAGYKYRPGIGPDADRRTVDLLVDAVGDRCDVLLDCHTWWKAGGDAYDRETVTSLVRAAVERGVGWVEEPVPSEDHAGYERLADETDAPLAGGESEPDAEGLLELADTGAVDYLQGDVRHHGGYTGCWRAVEYCTGRDVTFVPHQFGTWLGLVANAHLLAAAPGADLLEYPVFEGDPALAPVERDPGMYPFDLAFDVIEEDLDVSAGRLAVPDGPGLGVSLNRKALGSATYQYIEGPWTEFHYDE